MFRQTVLRSLRFRITSMAMMVVIVVLLAFAAVLLRSVNTHLVQQVDRGLLNEVAYTKSQLGSGHFLGPAGPAGQLGQLFLANGTLLGASNNMKGLPPLIHIGHVETRPRLSTIYSSHFGHVRIVVLHLGNQSSPVLLEGQEINQIFEADASLTELLVIVLPILALALGGLIWFVVGRAMKPVEAVRSAVSDISATNLDQRVPSPRSGDELDRLVDTMNKMLERLETALKKEHRFIADASHELRSPMAAIRGALEYNGGDLAGMLESHQTALSALQRLDILVDDLLILDSVDGSRTGPPKRLVDLDELVLLQVEQLRRGTGLMIDASNVSAGQVMAREVDMMRVIENLSSNAVRHADSRIEYSVTERDDQVWFTVGNDGASIPVAMRTAVFERFTRLDSDRTRAKGGSGLGLAIVHEIVKAYGGQVWVESTPSLGANFIVQLPATTTTMDVHSDHDSNGS
jgi:signal transduction histidine kinase